MKPENIIFDECQTRIGEINLSKFKNKNVCVLGGNSFLATYIISILSNANLFLKLNCTVSLFSKNKPNYIISKILKLDKKVNFFRFNFTPSSDYKSYFKKFKYDYTFFCLTYGQPAKWLEDEIITVWLNTELLKFFLEKTLKNKSKIMFFSSVDVYGDTSKYKYAVNEDVNSAVHLFSNRVSYGESKRLGEVYCKIYREKKGLDVYVVRPAHTYGPGMSKSDRRVIVELIQKGLKLKKINLLDKGKSMKTYGYIFDIAKMFLLIIQFGKEHTYNTTGKDFITIYNLASKIGESLSIKTIGIGNSKLAHIQNDNSKSLISSKKCYKEFKINNLTKLEDGILNLVKWLKLLNAIK